MYLMEQTIIIYLIKYPINPKRLMVNSQTSYLYKKKSHSPTRSSFSLFNISLSISSDFPDHPDMRVAYIDLPVFLTSCLSLHLFTQHNEKKYST